jgi:hypothetical protein
MKTEIAKQSQKERKPMVDNILTKNRYPGTLLTVKKPQQEIVELTKDMLVRYNGDVYRVDTDTADNWTGHTYMGSDCTEKNCDDPDCGRQALSVSFVEVSDAPAES